MGVSTAESFESEQPWGPLAWRVILWACVALVGYEVIHFYLRDPLHYIIDPTEKSFGPYWPHRIGLWTHIGGATLALFFGPFQFWTGLRDRNPAVHRITGYIYLTGILIGGCGAWYMATFTTPRSFGIALYSLTAAWWITVGMAFLAIRRGRIAAHKEWMIRGYVVTLAFVAFRWIEASPLLGDLGSEARNVTIGWACWAVPLLITEVALQWRRTMGTARITTQGA